MPSLILTPDAVNESKNTNNSILHKNFLTDTEISSMSWEKITELYRLARQENANNFYSFATGSIDIEKIQINKKPYMDIISNKIKEMHKGNMIASSLSISFIGRDNNKINDDDQLEFKKIFESHNHFKAPKNLPNFANIKTPKFFYSVDTFFIQISGTSSWKIENEFPEEFLFSPGDIVFIPKKLVHSAEYLSPGSMLSLSFSD